jgi:thioredoxin-like negative regulator of GroEL
MGRREKPIDDVQPFAEFANGLRTLRIAAGRPSLRAIADKIHYSVGYLSDTLSGKMLPTWEFTSAFVQLCGGDPKEWSVRWEKARAMRAPRAAAGPALRSSNRTPVLSGNPVQASQASRAEEPTERDSAAKMPGLHPDMIHNLAELSQALDQLRGGRSYAQLDRAAGGRPRAPVLPTSTVSNMIHGKSVPSKDTMVIFLTACGLTGSKQEPWLAARERAATGHLHRPAGAVRVRSADPHRLGVHASIQVYLGAEDLPAYVPRDVDADLRTAVTAALDRGGFVLVKGSSSVGKTRALFEAVKAVCPDWWLWHPADAAAVRAFADAPAPRTVVWLDELQRYLTQPGGVPAGAVRALLAAKLLVVATLWPGEYISRTALRTPGQDDPYAEDRELLALARIVEVPDTFSHAERRRAEDLAADQRIRVALNTADGGVTQVLAAGPELIRRWEHADVTDPRQSYGKAVITAALDARRVGATAPLSRDFLIAAAPAYLSSAQQATAPPDWLDQALGYATTRLHGATACLIPVAAGIGHVAGWTTADFLYQHARNQRRTQPVPDQVWQALVDHHHPDDTRRLAVNAERRGRWSDARRLWDGVIQQSSTDRAPVERLVHQGRVGDLRRLADAGNLAAASALAGLLVELGRVDEATETLRHPAETGDRTAASALAGLLAALGRADEAIAVLRPSADAGAEEAASALAGLLVEHGRIDEVIAVLRQRADAGNDTAAYRLADLLAEQGRIDELRQRADAGDGYAASRLADLLGEQGRIDEVIAVLRQRADAGDTSAAVRLAGLLAEHGRADEAIAVLRQRADAGDTSAAIRLISLLAEHRRLHELRDEVQAGTPSAYQMLQSLDAEPTSDAPQPDRRVGSGRPA